MADGVVLDLRYEARDIDQEITSQERIDKWFDAKTRGLNDYARASSNSAGARCARCLAQRAVWKIVAISSWIWNTSRLMDGRNAILVSDSIYNACRFYEMFQKTV